MGVEVEENGNKRQQIAHPSSKMNSHEEKKTLLRRNVSVLPWLKICIVHVFLTIFTLNNIIMRMNVPCGIANASDFVIIH